jgi:chloramphenicol 3-O phosphotransferase
VGGRVVVLNGGSSAGKTTLTRALQDILPEVWFRAGIDTFLGAASIRLYDHPLRLTIGKDGSVRRGPEFDQLYEAYRASVGTFARGGANVIIDEVLLGGGSEQQAWRAALSAEPLWVGIRCRAEEAERRETQRGDRDTGMARGQADAVHDGVVYDVDLDLTAMSTAEAVVPIVAAIRERWPA